MTATKRAEHVCMYFPDADERKVCYQCGREEGFGRTGLSITNMARHSPLGRGRVHDIICTVPEPIAALDDDEFASAGGLA